MKILKKMILGRNPSIFKDNCLFMSNGNGKMVGFDIESEKIVKEIKIPFLYVQISPVLDRLLVSGQGRYILVDYDLTKIEEFTKIEDIENFHLSSLLQNPIYAGAFDKDLKNTFIYKYPELKLVSIFPKDSDGDLYYFENYRVVETGKKNRRIEFANYLTGETLWQRSFEELDITRLDKFVGDAGEVLVCVCDENLLLGLDKTTGAIRWRVRQRVKTSKILLNTVSGNLYQFYNTWEYDEYLEEDYPLIFLEINTQTGEILYDDDIFKHPKHQPIEGLGTNEEIINWRFHNALQWGSKIYFLLSNKKVGTRIAKVVAFDVILHQFTEVLDTLFYITANECWFMAEGKIFLTSKLMDRIEIEHPNDYIKGFESGNLAEFEQYFNQKLDSEKYNRVDSFEKDNTKEYCAYAITKEEYLTIIDLEENA